MMRICRWELELIVISHTVNNNDDSKDNLYEELEQVFDHFPTYNMQILLGCCKAKFGTEDKIKPTTGKDHRVWIYQTLEKRWEYKGTVHKPFKDFKETHDLFRRKVLTNILFEFAINMTLVS